MSSINKFKRYELKYLLSSTQYNKIIQEIEKYLSVDKYGEVTIQSLYYDNESFLLIRKSTAKPISIPSRIFVPSIIKSDESFAPLEIITGIISSDVERKIANNVPMVITLPE